MKIVHMSTARPACLVAMAALLVTSGGCGVQGIPKARNKVEATTAEVTNQYKRRADLIPNLVKVVKGYAKHERETLEAVVQARAAATKASVNVENADPAKVERFMRAQGDLTQALSRLMVVVERYPELKADRNFRELQAQLEGTENRITVARQRHIEAIREFNDMVTVPPQSWTNRLFYHYEKLPQWTLDEGEKRAAEKPPDVDL